MKPQINLVNPALLPPKPFFQFRSLVLSVLLVAVVLTVFSLLVHSGLGAYERSAAAMQARIAQREAQVAKSAQKLRPRQKDPAVAAALQLAEAEQLGLTAVLASLDGDSPEAGLRPAGLFMALGEVAPGAVWLTGIDLAAGQVSLQGMATGPAAIPPYLAALARQPALQGQRFAVFDLARQPVGEAAARRELLRFRLGPVQEGQP